MTQPPISPGLRFLLSTACLVIVVAGMRGAATILVPLSLALFVAVVSLPLLNLIRQRGVPTGIGIFFVVLFDAAALFLFGWMVSLATLEVRARLPHYVGRVQAMEESLIGWLGEHGLPTAVSLSGSLSGLDAQRIFGIGLDLIRGATGILTTFFVVTLIFIFVLAEASSFPRKLRVVMGRNWGDFGRSAKMVREIQNYLAIKTLISAATGLTVGVVMWGIGLDFPLLWGLLAFLMNFIPNVGSIIAAVPPVVVGLLQVGPGIALLVALIFVGVNALFGNFLEPMLMGRQFGLSTLVVVLSLIFWGWLWGPIGMFLSVPLTMTLKIGLENSEEFRWVAYLMNAESRQRPLESVPSPVPPPSTGVSRPATGNPRTSAEPL